MAELAGYLMNHYKNDVTIIDINLSKEYSLPQIEEYVAEKVMMNDISLIVLNTAYLLDGPL